LAADGVDLAILQGAQKLDLNVERQFADLVEKQRAAMGFSKFADMFLIGAGEGAFLMAEQNRFNEFFRDRAAIDGNQRFVLARAGAFDRAGNHFFADAGFALDQDRYLRFGGALGQLHNARHRR
jgi:hypothetical protein